jgi:hypothetical protein
VKRVPLNLGRWKATIPTKFALVDDDDFAFVSRYKWHASKDGRYWYAKTNWFTERGKRPISMHRMILGFPRGLIDHRNLNGLDNRRRNLRLATKAQNAANSPGHRDRKSKHKGVCFEKFTGRWLAQLRVNGKRVLKARFDTEAEAAIAYTVAVVQHCGEFGRIK